MNPFLAAVGLGLLGAVVFLAINIYNYFNGHRVKSMEKFQGPKKNRLFGNALDFERESSAFFEQLVAWCGQYQGLLVLWFGPSDPFMLLYKPQYVEILLSSSRQITKSRVYDFVHPWLGTGLLTSTGEKWKTRRRLITPTFHFKILNDFVQVFDEQALQLTSILKAKQNGKAFNIFPFITCCALDIIAKTSMGKSINAQKDSSSEYVKAVLRISEVIQMRQKSPWLWPDIIYNLTAQGREHNQCLHILHGFTNQVIDERIEERRQTLNADKAVQQSAEETPGKRRKRRLVAFIDLLLDAYDAGEIDREGVREEVDTFMFEGHDTTAAGIVWAIQLLGSHPDIQARVQKEVDEFFDHRPETLTVDTVKELKYLECAVKESLRIFPSVPFFGRKTTEECEIDGKLVPKGVSVGVCPLALHRNPDVWPDPFKFDPDRFLPENSEGRHPYAYVPFSAGSRNCIGQKFALLEEKVVLAYILHHFNIVSSEATEEIKTCGELITRPRDGIFVTLTPRTENNI